MRTGRPFRVVPPWNIVGDDMTKTVHRPEGVDPMSALGAPSIAPAEILAERTRTGVLATLMLDRLCGLGPGETSDRCGKTSCGYFDEPARRCGLRAWDILGRLGPETLRWFIEHRTSGRLAETAEIDEMLLARTCAL